MLGRALWKVMRREEVPTPAAPASNTEEDVLKGQAPTPSAVSRGPCSTTCSAGAAGRGSEATTKRQTRESGHVDPRHGTRFDESQKVGETR